MMTKRKAATSLHAGTLTYEQKKQLCEKLDTNPGMRQKDLAEWAKTQFQLARAPTQGTVSNILRSRANYLFADANTDLSSIKKARVLAFPELDEALAVWARETQNQGGVLTTTMLQDRARELAGQMAIEESRMPPFTSGWANHFRKRHNLKDHHGQGNSLLVNQSNAKARKLQQQLASHPFAASASTNGKISPSASTSAAVTSVLAALHPLVYVAAKAISTVQGRGHINWTRLNGKSDQETFAVVNDGILAFQSGLYTVNVDVEHSQPRESYAQVFKLWHGKTLLGQCTSPLRCKKDVALSVLEWKGDLPANAVLRVEFTAPGFAFHDSRLVIRRVHRPQQQKAISTLAATAAPVPTANNNNNNSSVYAAEPSAAMLAPLPPTSPPPQLEQVIGL